MKSKESAPEQYCVTESGYQVPILSLNDKVSTALLWAFASIVAKIAKEPESLTIKGDASDIMRMIGIQFEVWVGLNPGSFESKDSPKVQDLSLAEMKLGARKAYQDN